MQRFGLTPAQEGIREYRGPSLDSEDSYYLKLHHHLDTSIPSEQLLLKQYKSPNVNKERINNSHSAVHLQHDYNRMSDLSQRKMTKDLKEQLHYDSLKTIGWVYDEAKSTLELDYSLLDPDEPLIIDKGIMKFHPGFSINYVSRWVQVTKTVIRFYKNYYHSVCNFRRPLAVIPFSAISQIKSTKLTGPKNNTVLNPFDNNQFEIVLNEEYEVIYDLNRRKREVEDIKYELELIQKLEYQNKLKKNYKRFRHKCRLSKSLVPTFKLYMGERRGDILKLSRSHPRLPFNSRLYEDDNSRFVTNMNKSQEIVYPVTLIASLI